PKDQTENVEQGISEVSAPIRDDIVALRKPAIRAVMSAASHLALFPVQDLLGLGADARINFPGYPQGNWRWRLLPGQLTEERKNEFRELTEENSRAVL
ncbi:MAG: 4-alpha-glucanotransferase, partial [Thermoguttaceae bacterium]|nr:4-alpha-glucanotransferase [Thermoguttaceae bacterium]